MKSLKALRRELDFLLANHTLHKISLAPNLESLSVEYCLANLPYKKLGFTVSLAKNNYQITLQSLSSDLLAKDADDKLNMIINTEFNKEVNSNSGLWKLRKIITRISQIKARRSQL